MNDAAIAGEEAAVRDGNDIAKRRDAVLQGHAHHSPSSFRGAFASSRNDTYGRSGGWYDSAVSQGK